MPRSVHLAKMQRPQHTKQHAVFFLPSSRQDCLGNTGQLLVPVPPHCIPTCQHLQQYNETAQYAASLYICCYSQHCTVISIYTPRPSSEAFRIFYLFLAPIFVLLLYLLTFLPHHSSSTRKQKNFLSQILSSWRPRKLTASWQWVERAMRMITRSSSFFWVTMLIAK